MAFEPLESPDTHYLSGATGWLELGNVDEATAELGLISPQQQKHPMVLELRWLLLAKRENWAAALEVARALIESAPDLLEGWIHHAYAMRRAPGFGLAHAWSALLPVADKFPKEPIVCFNLACYAAQLGNLDDAWAWLEKAMKTGGATAIRKMALADADLEPLWPKLGPS
jgi:tetratricopeptide (TPR) repeat protein